MCEYPIRFTNDNVGSSGESGPLSLRVFLHLREMGDLWRLPNHGMNFPVRDA